MSSRGNVQKWKKHKENGSGFMGRAWKGQGDLWDFQESSGLGEIEEKEP